MAEELQAPDMLAAIKRVFADHPEIDTRLDDDAVRGRIVDWCCHSLNPPGTNRPWGRKARNQDGTNKNGDALTYLRTDGKFEIYDIINGADGKAMWGKPSRSLAQGENGYWTPAEPVQTSQPTQPEQPATPTPPQTGTSITVDLGPIIAAALAPLQAEIIALRQKIESQQPATAFPKVIALRAKSSGRFVSADESGQMVADRQALGPWEQFDVVEP